jgi:HD superfamily phosphohydrolase
VAEIKLRDPVHNFIRFGHEEMKLIDLDVLQRLRGISQLAMASFVYPGAVHTRFDHTLGVCHVAGEMAEALELDEDDRNFVRLAALLHDIGHGPFSHVSENALERFADRGSLPEGQKRNKIHEVITEHLIRSHRTVVRRLGKDRCDRVAKLLTVGVGDPIQRAIVSGPLDADKQDYLLRDSLFAGVNYGVFDIHQLQRSLVAEEVDGQRELMIRAEGVHAIEQFVMAKYYLTSMVYRHKIRLVTDQMIFRAIVLGIESDGNRELARLYTFVQEDRFYANYLRWNDAIFLDRFGVRGKRDAKCTKLLKRLVKRDLLKRVFFEPAKEFDAECKERVMEVGKRENSDIRAQMERAIADVLAAEFKTEIDANFTILHTYQIKSVRESSRNDEASILVAKTGGMPRKFEDESILFSSIDQRLSDEYVEVYAPVCWDDHAERTRHLNAITPIIKEIISTYTRSIQLSLKL